MANFLFIYGHWGCYGERPDSRLAKIGIVLTGEIGFRCFLMVDWLNKEYPLNPNGNKTLRFHQPLVCNLAKLNKSVIQNIANSND